jgi:hypothetical protein
MVKTKDKGLILLFFILKNDGIVEFSFNSSFSRYIGWNGVNTQLFKVREFFCSYQNLSRLLGKIFFTLPNFLENVQKFLSLFGASYWWVFFDQ